MSITDSLKVRLSTVLLIILAVCYSLQIVTPLRLNTDAIVLLSMADSAAHGGGFLDAGKKTVFPLGYPAVLYALLKARLAHSWVIVGLNLVFLAAGLIALYSLLLRDFFVDRTVLFMVCNLSLLSFVVIKHSTLPLTDVPFFCCSMCCLDVMSRAVRVKWDWRFVVLVGSALLLAILGILVRRVGIALVPPLLFIFLGSSQSKSLLMRVSTQTKLTIAAGLFTALAAITVLLAKTSTLSDFTGVAKSDIVRVVVTILNYRFTEFGELLMNLPDTKMHGHLLMVAPFIGLFLFALVLAGLVVQWRKLSPTEAYLICYLGILFAWPYAGARFWLPVIPLFIAYVLLALKRLGIPRHVLTAYVVVYALVGCASIAYSTRISFADGRFPDLYGDGTLRPTYCAAFQSCGNGYDPAKVDPRTLALLHAYK